MRGGAEGEVRADGRNNQRMNKVFRYGLTHHIATHTTTLALIDSRLLHSQNRGDWKVTTGVEVCFQTTAVMRYARYCKSSGIYPLHQAKAIKLSKSDFISQSCCFFFYRQAKTTLTPVLIAH